MSVALCLCGHKLVEHDETGQCRPVLMIGASQGMGPLTHGRCDCREPVVAPKVSESKRLFDAAMGMAEAAAAQGRVELALSEARVAKLRAAAELERAGRMEEAETLLAEVRAEQERAK